MSEHTAGSAASKHADRRPGADTCSALRLVAASALAVRFLLELAALVALGWWGATRRPAPLAVALAVAAPTAAALAWGRWVAPRAPHRLGDPARFALESVVWVAAGLATAELAGCWLGLTFGGLALATALAARRWEPAPPPRPSR